MTKFLIDILSITRFSIMVFGPCLAVGVVIGRVGRWELALAWAMLIALVLGLTATGILWCVRKAQAERS